MLTHITDPTKENFTTMNLKDTLLAYSDWLDGEELMPKNTSDNRTHEDLIEEFIEHWYAPGNRAPLIGDEPRKSQQPDSEVEADPRQVGMDTLMALCEDEDVDESVQYQAAALLVSLAQPKPNLLPPTAHDRIAEALESVASILAELDLQHAVRLGLFGEDPLPSSDSSPEES